MTFKNKAHFIIMSDQVEKGVLGLKNKLEGEIFVCQNL